MRKRKSVGGNSEKRKRPKAKHGEGTVFRRRDGRWQAQLMVAGKRLVEYAADERQALDKLDALKARASGAGGLGYTLTELLDRWVAHANVTVRPKTAAYYQETVARLKQTALADEAFTKLNRDQIETALADYAHTPLKIKRPRTPARATVQGMLAVLRMALEWARERGALLKNPAHKAKLPAMPKPQIQPPTARELSAIFSTSNARWLPLLKLLVLSGLRRGEALGLAWQDIDLDRGVLTVRHSLQRVPACAGGKTRLELSETKTPGSRKTVELSTNAVEALREQQRLQSGWQQNNEDWQDCGLVFTTTNGGPLEPRNVQRALNSLQKSAGVRKWRVHDSRHATASLLVNEGVDLKTISEILRHSNYRTTAELYAHLVPATRRAAVNKIGEALARGAASDSTSE